MKLHISDKKGVPIQEGMIGLFFEDINYAADGGLYAEMIENRSFEFQDCYGTVGDYYTTVYYPHLDVYKRQLPKQRPQTLLRR